MVCPKFNVRGSLRRQKNFIHAYPIIIAYLCKSHMLRFQTGFFRSSGVALRLRDVFLIAALPLFLV